MPVAVAISVAVETIADRVKLLRELSGLSGAELGRRAKLSRATVPSLEAGRNEEPEVKTLSALAKLTSCDPGWLLTGVGSPPTEEQVKSAVSAVPPGGEAA